MKWVIGSIAGTITLFAIAIVYAAGFTSSFTGNPAAPAPLDSGFLNGYDVQVHDRDMWSDHIVHSVNAQHGADCGAPPATHLVNTVNASVFQCRDHVMTSLNGDSYGVIYMTPPQLADFSAGPAVIKWDMSTEKLSTRDWWDVVISPFGDSQALPAAPDLGVDLQGTDRNSVIIDSFSQNLVLVRDGTISYMGGGPDISTGIPSDVNQAAVRQHLQVTIWPDRLRFERLASTGVDALLIYDIAFAPLSWQQGVVRFGHHSYDPFKDGAGVAATWHWDEINIDPAVPFYIAPVDLGANDRYVKLTPGQTTVVTSASVANAFLRFSANCRPSVNGVFASPQTGAVNEHFASYSVPVTGGSWIIGFGSDAANGGHDCAMKDASIWGNVGTTSTPTVTTTPTPSPTATATPTATPRTYRCQVRNANGSYTTVWTKVGGGACP